MKASLIKLLDNIEVTYGYTKVDNIGNKIAKTGLIDQPLILNSELDLEKRSPIRVDTVHKVKGESLDAVLYIASKSNIDALLEGVDTETGRIGYVAVTRARDLFVLGVPINSVSLLGPKLEAIGLKKL